jgi:hypothetical protein
MKRKILLATLIPGVFAASLLASEPPTQIQFVRPLGMGGAFTAIADDHNIFSFNPAGLVQRTGSQFTLLEIAGGVSKDTKDVIDFIDDNKESFDHWGDNPAQDQQVVNKIVNELSQKDPRAYVAANTFTYLSGPIWGGAHIGFGAQGVVDSSFRLDVGAGGVPSVSFSINNDVVVPVTLAKRWESRIGNIGVGLTGKLMRRYKVEQERVSVFYIDNIDEPPIAQGDGFGSDLGLLYQPGNRMNIGLMVQDFGGTKLHFDAEPSKNGFQGYNERDTVIRPRTNIGVAVVPAKLLWLLPTGDRWTFSADIRDIAPGDQHVLFQNGFKQVVGDDFGTHAHLGAEFRYWFLRFRGGAYQGYPTAGLGIDIPLLKLDFAYYGREIGAQAGDRRQDNYVASLAIAFGSGKVEARERISKNKEKNKQRTLGNPSPEESTESAPAETTPATPPASGTAK